MIEKQTNKSPKQRIKMGNFKKNLTLIKLKLKKPTNLDKELKKFYPMIYSHHTRFGIYISYRPFTWGIRQKNTLRDELIIISYHFYQNRNCTMEDKVVEIWVF